MASVTKQLSSSRKSKRNEDVQEDNLEAGFKFSRQSRYRKVPPKKGSDGKSARKKRRSSFAQGRKKRKSLAFSSVPLKKAVLYKEIPVDLPTDERLKKLFDACIKNAIEKLDTNSSEFNIDGITNFNEEAKEVFSHLKTLITESSVVSDAFMPTSSEVKKIPNPKNRELDSKLASLVSATERWKTESQQWDKLLEFHKESEAKSERKLQATDAQIAERCPDFLSPEQDHLLSEKPSLKGLSERVDKLKQQTFLQLDTVVRAVDTLQEYQEAVSRLLSTNIKTFAKKTFEPPNQTATPRTVIPRLLKRH
ncbi:uncharacterized protein LOC141884935 [Acropora palmata]|uniref:uncharacterized protein LOC141884935 n=1 Tax=Acropora palmata TaxID=6131 RepID=UPI003DA098F9